MYKNVFVLFEWSPFDYVCRYIVYDDFESSLINLVSRCCYQYQLILLQFFLVQMEQNM